MTCNFCDPVNVAIHHATVKLVSGKGIKTYEINDEYVFLPFAPILYNRRKYRKDQFRGVIGMCRMSKPDFEDYCDNHTFPDPEEDFSTTIFKYRRELNHRLITETIDYAWYINGSIDTRTDLTEITKEECAEYKVNLKEQCSRNWRVAAPHKIFKRITVNLLMKEFLWSRLTDDFSY